MKMVKNNYTVDKCQYNGDIEMQGPHANGNAVQPVSDGKQKGSTGRFAPIAVLMLLAFVIIGLFIVIIIVMMRQTSRTDSLVTTVDDLKEQLEHQWVGTQQEDLSCMSPDCIVIAGNTIAKMDFTEDPCDNFYEYACAAYKDDPRNPQDRRSWGTLYEVNKINKVYLKKLLESEGDLYRGEESKGIKMAKTFYKTCMDKGATEEAGAQPLLQLINDLGSWTLTSNEELDKWDESSWNFEDAIANIHLSGVEPIFMCGVDQDLYNATYNTIWCDQGVNLLTSQSYYQGNRTSVYRQAIIDFITDLAVLLDGSNATAMAEKIWDLDQALALAKDPPSARTTFLKLYKAYTLTELQDLLGDSIDLSRYFEKYFGFPLPANEKLVVYASNYFEKMAAILKEANKETLNNLMMVRVAESFLSYMSTQYAQLMDNLAEVLYGSANSEKQWEKCVSQTVDNVGFAAGALFAEEHFSPTDKMDVEMMVNLVREAFIEGLPGLEWMDPVTKQHAETKAEQMIMKIGYPDWLETAQGLDKYHEGLSIGNVSFNNVVHSSAFQIQKILKKYGKPVDRTIWYMTPSILNAYYAPALNEMVYPAGILQAPLYHRSYPKAMTYGSIGMVMGHELTHGFDNNGRMYDSNGNPQNWWENSSAIHFNDNAQCFVDQYGTFLIHGQPHDGEMTLGENIADNGGLRLAYRAYESWMEQVGGQDRYLPGLNMTHEQLFYLGYAQTWCNVMTKEWATYLLAVDVHSNAKYRTNGVMMNSPGFAQAFNCPVGSPMNPKDKCEIWT